MRINIKKILACVCCAAMMTSVSASSVSAASVPSSSEKAGIVNKIGRAHV